MSDTPSSTQVILRLLTREPHTPSSNELIDQQVEMYRASCGACGGSQKRCLAGTGHPDFERLKGCAAYDLEGKVATLKPVRQAPRQPWDVKPSRRAA